jgi:hypothetical protein
MSRDYARIEDGGTSRPKLSGRHAQISSIRRGYDCHTAAETSLVSATTPDHKTMATSSVATTDHRGATDHPPLATAQTS